MLTFLIKTFISSYLSGPANSNTAMSCLKPLVKKLNVKCGCDAGKAPSKMALDKENQKPYFDSSLLVSVSKLDTKRDSVQYLSSENGPPKILKEREVQPYARQIFDYLFSKEQTDGVDVSFLGIQKEINEKIRAILVDWLVDASSKLKLRQETLFLAVRFFDKYLGKVQVERRDLQAIGLACLFMSAK